MAQHLGIEYHRLRSRDTGREIIADVHLLCPGSMPLKTAHRLATEFEAQLDAKLDVPLELVSHLESIEDHE